LQYAPQHPAISFTSPAISFTSEDRDGPFDY